jgi:hypothetical protein
MSTPVIWAVSGGAYGVFALWDEGKMQTQGWLPAGSHCRGSQMQCEAPGLSEDDHHAGDEHYGLRDDGDDAPCAWAVLILA